jgi:hypothetical protein
MIGFTPRPLLLRAVTVAMACMVVTGTVQAGATPAAPVVHVGTSGQLATASWGLVPDATGYTLHYASYPNSDLSGAIDVGAATSLSAMLPPGSAYTVSVRARNASGDSAPSNAISFHIPSGGMAVLTPGDYWEFDWFERTASSSSAGSTSRQSEGSFRVTVGLPQVMGGRTAYPLSVTGSPPAGQPVWKALATDGPLLLGTKDGSVYGTVFRSDAETGWKGAGFFTFFPPDRTGVAVPGTFQGPSRNLNGWVVSRTSSSGGCTYYPEVGQSICGQDYSSYSEREFYQAGVGPIGYQFRTSVMYTGGGFTSVHNIVRTVELVKSSRVADDGTVFTGPAWSRLADMPPGFSNPNAAALEGTLFVTGGAGNNVSLASYSAATATWSPAAPNGTFITGIFGLSMGSIHALGGRTLLRLDPATRQWQPIAGTLPSLSNPCGTVALGNGDLAVVDCPGSSDMKIHVYSMSTHRWGAPVTARAGIVLRPAVAAVGNDVYVMGGYANSSTRGIIGTVRRFRASTGTWEVLSAPMRTPRDETMAYTSGSRIHVIGGRGKTNDVPTGRVVEVLDTTSMTWSTGPALPSARSRFAVSSIDGRLVVLGGLDSSNTWTSTAFALKP